MFLLTKLTKLLQVQMMIKKNKNNQKAYAYGKKGSKRKKEEIKCDNIIKQYKKQLTLIILQKKK